MELEIENNRRLFGKSLLEGAIFTWTRKKKKDRPGRGLEERPGQGRRYSGILWEEQFMCFASKCPFHL